MTQELIIVATVLRPHGRHGEVRLQLETDYPDTLLNSARIYVGIEPGEPAAVEGLRMHKETPLLKLAGIDTIDAAKALRGKAICLPKDELAPLESGEFFLHDLVGLDVIDHNGDEIGNAEWILETGGTPILVVTAPDGEEFMIPFSPDAVGDVSLEENRITLNDLPGLLDINRK
jgi:16S rRNA processing protein RimM